MEKVLEKPPAETHSASGLESGSSVPTIERPPPRVPEERRPPQFIKWMGWLLALVLVVGVAAVIWIGVSSSGDEETAAPAVGTGQTDTAQMIENLIDIELMQSSDAAQMIENLIDIELMQSSDAAQLIENWIDIELMRSSDAVLIISNIVADEVAALGGTPGG